MSKADPPELGGHSDEGPEAGAVLAERENILAWFQKGSNVLFVTFDPLKKSDRSDAPRPWLYEEVRSNGYSVLGLIAKRQDWYRNADTPDVISELAGQGFFADFDRVVFAGTDSGAYAALTYSRLVPGCDVLALAPITSLNKKIVPFENRFAYPLKSLDWTTPEYLDAADAAPAANHVYVLYDPFLDEEKLHATRIAGDNIEYIKCRHFGGRLTRHLESCGALEGLVGAVGAGQFSAKAFAGSLGGRRKQRNWCKKLLFDLSDRNHPKLALALAEKILEAEKKPGKVAYAARIRDALQGMSDAEVDQPAALSETITVGTAPAEGPFKGAIERIPGGFVVPERKTDQKMASGVLYQDRSYCGLSESWIRRKRSIPAPNLLPREDVEKMEGRYLFAGHFRAHFGHFLVESTAAFGPSSI